MTEYEKGYGRGYEDAVSDRRDGPRLPRGSLAFLCFLGLCACVWYITGVTP